MDRLLEQKPVSLGDPSAVLVQVMGVAAPLYGVVDCNSLGVFLDPIMVVVRVRPLVS